ncbi:hypothetical protein ACFE04_027260 [Oxalis oulophora]
MASLSSIHFISSHSCHSNSTCYPLLHFSQLPHFGLLTKSRFSAISNKKIALTLTQDYSVHDNDVVIPKPKARKASKRTRKKPADIDTDSTLDQSFRLESDNATDEEKVTPGLSQKSPPQDLGQVSTDFVEEKTVKKGKRGRPKKKPDIPVLESETERSNLEESATNEEGELDLKNYGGEDVSLTYGWPPLVCCFGAAQHYFIPSGRPANRLIDYEVHERMKDALWAPEKFIRAPGGSPGSVAIALASLGGKVAFMGKVGDDTYGQAMLEYMNASNVQTQSVRIDSKRGTAVSLMKIGKRGSLKMSCVKPCAEDCLSKADINIDVLREAKMFYFTTHSLLDRNMRSTTLEAIKLAKKCGSIIFYDVNLPMPLWESIEETTLLIQEVWSLANIVEVTKQELEFLCGIKPFEEFDTKNNTKSKFVHYGLDVVGPMWDENLKVLFVTNGTSKIHYYTNEHNGSVIGMEAAPITPFTCDMSASGDGIIAGIMKMLTVQPQLITDKGYLEQTIQYAINCGVTDQWLLSRALGHPPREDMIGEIEPDENGFRSVSEKEYRTVKTVD